MKACRGSVESERGEFTHLRERGREFAGVE